MTNFLLALLLNIKGNHTGAIHYLKQTLRVDSNLYDGKALMLLKTLACREKFNVVTGNRAGMFECNIITFVSLFIINLLNILLLYYYYITIITTI